MTAPRVTERRRRLLEAGRHPFVAAVRRSLAGACGVERNATVIVGVSGGPDSLALLLALAAIAGRSRRSGGIRPLALHVNHHLRPEAAADARFVGRRCEELGIACEVVEIHPAARRGNRHAAARELRYAALAEAAAWRGAAHVATAHHADDQLETMVMALCRGAGPDGLEGIAWRRPLAPGVELIRPLLDRRKAECEAFCRAVGVRWRRDAGNTDQRRARGRLRREILPALERAWPGAAARATTTAEILAAAKWAMDQTAPRPLANCAAVEADAPADEVVFERAALAAVPWPIAALAIRRAAIALAPGAADAIDAAMCRNVVGLATRRADPGPRGALRWPGAILVRIERGRVVMRRTPIATASTPRGDAVAEA